MKKHVKFLLVCLAFWFGCLEIFAQSTQFGVGPFGHTPLGGGVPIRYCGWDASAAANAIPFSLEHRGTNNINFRYGTPQVTAMTVFGTAAVIPGMVQIFQNGFSL